MRVMTYIGKLRNCDTQYREKELKNEEIRGFQHNCISYICKNQGLMQEEIAKRMMVDKSTITRWLASFEEKGYIIRKKDEKNRRIIRVYPTEKTLEMQPEMHKIYEAWDDYLLEDFTDEQKEELKNMLDIMLKKAMKKINLEQGE